MQKKHPLKHLIGKEKEVKKELSPLESSDIIPSLPLSTSFEKMGCLILAGGEGTRLGWRGAKGCMPLPLPGSPTLFQLLLEEIHAKGKDLKVAIMTSPLNREEITSYLKEREYFGLKQVVCFEQELFPVSSCKGECIYREGERVEAPMGNGRAFYHFYQSGVWHVWKKRGIEVVQVIFIDNPLSSPFDGRLLGLHEERRVELALRCVERAGAHDALGVVGVEEGRLRVQEYTELFPSLNAKRNGGDLLFPFGSTGIFSCSLSFIERVHAYTLPWHLAYKEGREGKVIKFETFLCDLFPYARSFTVVPSERRRFFAPLKKREDLSLIPLRKGAYFR